MKERFDLVKEADISGFQLPTGKAAQAGKFIQKGVGDIKSGCTDCPFFRTSKGQAFSLVGSTDPHRGFDENIIEKPTRPKDVLVPPYFPDTEEVMKDLALYYDEIMADRFVGDAADELKAQKVDENTLVLFISDNGRPFGTRRHYSIVESVLHGFCVGPKRSRLEQLTANSCSVDIAPTFLELAGIRPPKFLAGTSFLPSGK